MVQMNKKPEKILLQWSSGGEKKDPNATIWMVVLFLFTGATLIYNLIRQDWMVAVVFVFLIIILIWYFFSSSKTVDIIIADNGIQINNTFYDFENIKGYWHSDRNGIFYLEPKKKTGFIISFPMGGKTIEEIKKNLPDYLTEIEGRGGDLIDRISGVLHM